MDKIRFNQNLSLSIWLKTIYFICLASFLNPGLVKAQSPSTLLLGNTAGSGNWFYGPIYRNTTNAGTFNFSRHAYLYTAAELSAIPAGAKITKLEWLKKDGGTIAAPNTFNVFLMNTPATTLGAAASWGTLVAGATQTYSNSNFNLNTASNAYLEAAFNVPGNDSFIYSGGSLQILTDWTKSGVQTGAGINFYVLSATGKALGIASNATLSNTSNLIASTYGNNRPTLRITYVPVPPCNGVPSTGPALSSVASACANVPFTLSITNTIAGSGITFQWQRADDAAFTQNLANVGTSSTFVTSQTTSHYFRCIASCAGSGLTDVSTPVYVPISQHYECYCVSSAISAADEEIYKFTIGSNCNASDCGTTAPGANSTINTYSNYQGIPPPHIEQSSTVPFSIQIGTCGTQYPNRCAIFIDYNHNSSFADPGELVYSTPAAINGPHYENGTITIPANAQLGLTGVRVISSETGSPITLSCGYYSFGETEDYLIDIASPTSCSGAPNPGNTISSISVGCSQVNSITICSGNTVSMTLQNLTSGSGVTYQWYSNTTLIPGATSYHYTTNAITSAQSFYCAVTCTNSGITTNSNPMSITLKPFTECYCTQTASLTDDEEIFSFTFNGTYNALNCTTVAPGPGSLLNMYSNFFPLNNYNSWDSVYVGQTVPFDVEVDDCDQAPYYSFGTAIWIDFNQNGSFSDPGEQVLSEPNPVQGPRHVIGNLVIPCTAKVGQTAMRVTVAGGLANGNLGPCTPYGAGETEDYLIFIKYPDTCSVASNPPGNTKASVVVFCDSTKSDLSLTQECLFDNFTYQWETGNPPSVPYTAIPGATNKTYTTPMLYANLTSFRCKVSCSSSPLPVYSTPVNIFKAVRAPVANLSSSTYCPGSTTPVTIIMSNPPTGGINYPTTYSYSTPVTFLLSNGSQATTTPSANTTYTITGVMNIGLGNTCSMQTTATINTTSLNVGLNSSAGSYCTPGGSPISLTASGATTYEYSPAAGLSSTTGTSVSATPSNTTTYIVTGSDATGCTGTNSTTIVVTSTTWYLDADADGYYAGSPVIACSSPGANYTTTPLIAGDCDDNNNAIHASYSFYIDNDQDGFGIGSLQSVCAVNANTPPLGYSLLDGDCNDNNNAIHATYPFYIDNDGDGYGVGSLQMICAVDGINAPVGYSLIDGDCDDNDNTIHLSFSFYVDNDLDGFGANAQMVCAVNANTPPSGYSLVDGDCNDNMSSVNPNATEICGNNIDDNCNTLIDEGCSLVLNLKLFIEGYYVGAGMMEPALVNEGVSTNPTACDSIIIELHAATSPYTLVATQFVPISTNGTASAIFPGTPPGNYYIAIKHRNALQTWSGSPVAISTTLYDFTTAATQAFGSNMKEVETGVWALYSGDLNADDNIDLLDFSSLEFDVNAFAFGYFPTDINGDGNVDLLDGPVLENNINNFVFSILP